MPSDIGLRLEAASASPSRPVDVASVWKTARRRTLIARAVTSATLVVAVAAPAGIYLASSSGPDRGIVPVEAASKSPVEDHAVLCVADENPPGSVTLESDEDADGCIPNDPSFARYKVTVEAEASDIAQKGDAPVESGVVNGLLEISPEDSSACLILTGLSFSEALLTDGETAVAFAAGESKGGIICVDAPARQLGIVNGDPGRFILEVHLGSGDVVTAPLVYLDQSAPERDCAGTHYLPSYLPWIERGDEIPAPEVGATPGTNGTMWLWASDEDLFDSAHLSIYTTRDSIRGADAGIRLLDNEGYLDLYAGGAMVISWDLGTETCNRVVLELTPEDDTSERSTETQLREIARSLQLGAEILTEEG